MSFFDLPARTVTILGAVIGYFLIDDLTPAEQNSLGNFLILIGQILETNAGQAAVLQAKTSNDRLNEIEEKIDYLMQKFS